jgi:hypothetical protein
MKPLQKFVKKGGPEPARVAYALDADKLPTPEEGARSYLVTDFNAADELLEHANLKAVFQIAIADGCAVLPFDPTI